MNRGACRRRTLQPPRQLRAHSAKEGSPLPRNFVTTNSTQLPHSLIATGRVLAFAFRTRLRLSNNRLGLKAVPVDLNIPYGSVGIVTLKNRTINPAAELSSNARANWQSGWRSRDGCSTSPPQV
jgi:hypothetical protein